MRWLRPLLCAIWRTLRPNSHFNRNISLTRRMAILDLGICLPPVLENRQPTQPDIRAAAALQGGSLSPDTGGNFQPKQVVRFSENRW